MQPKKKIFPNPYMYIGSDADDGVGHAQWWPLPRWPGSRGGEGPPTN